MWRHGNALGMNTVVTMQKDQKGNGPVRKCPYSVIITFLFQDVRAAGSPEMHSAGALAHTLMNSSSADRNDLQTPNILDSEWPPRNPFLRLECPLTQAPTSSSGQCYSSVKTQVSQLSLPGSPLWPRFPSPLLQASVATFTFLCHNNLIALLVCLSFWLECKLSRLSRHLGQCRYRIGSCINVH